MRILYARERHKPTWLGCWICPRCKSEILLEEGDYVQILGLNRVKFTCPQCGQCKKYESYDQKESGQMFSAADCEAAHERCSTNPMKGRENYP